MSVVHTESRDNIEVEGGQMVPTGKNGMNGKGWKALALTLLSVSSMLVGAFVGDFAASIRYTGLHGRMTDHERLQGHPVMIQKVDDLKAANQKALARIETKLERQSMVLREIEKRISENGK